MSIKSELAIQTGNAYKGKVCCYFSVTKRKCRESDPVLAFSKTSDVGINIFDPATQKGVKFFMGGTLPYYIFEKTRLCMWYAFMNGFKNQSTGNAPRESPAYTVKLKGGKYSGQTPAQILANPENYNGLVEQYNYIQKNLSNPQYAKYKAGNEEQLRAIQEACALYRAGTLAVSPTNAKICIWAGVRTPDVNKVDTRGMTDVRMIEIDYDTAPGEKEPYSIKIVNCMAPPVKNSQVGAKIAQAVDRVTLNMTFSEETWYGLWKDVIEAKQSFGRFMEGDRIRYSEANRWQASENKGNAQAASCQAQFPPGANRQMYASEANLQYDFQNNRQYA